MHRIASATHLHSSDSLLYLFAWWKAEHQSFGAGKYVEALRSVWFFAGETPYSCIGALLAFMLRDHAQQL
jgi:hypothetical protein